MINEKLILAMNAFNAGEPGLIHHLLKVYTYAHLIGVEEGIPAEELRILDMAAILHDIAIAPCMKNLGVCHGSVQEEYGPGYARELLKDFPEISESEVERICYLIAHHHTYVNVESMDHRILLEADFLVNSFENQMEKDAIEKFRDKVFETETGKRLLNTMFRL